MNLDVIFWYFSPFADMGNWKLEFLVCLMRLIFFFKVYKTAEFNKTTNLEQQQQQKKANKSVIKNIWLLVTHELRALDQQVEVLSSLLKPPAG